MPRNTLLRPEHLTADITCLILPIMEEEMLSEIIPHSERLPAHRALVTALPAVVVLLVVVLLVSLRVETDAARGTVPGLGGAVGSDVLGNVAAAAQHFAAHRAWVRSAARPLTLDAG